MYSYLYNTGSGHYKPVATRFPTLAFLLVITLFLIVLTELAIHSIPQHLGVGKLGDIVNETLKVNIERELDQSEYFTPILTGLPTFSRYTFFPSLSIPVAESSPASSPIPVPTETVTGGGYLSLGGSGPSTVISVGAGHPFSLTQSRDPNRPNPTFGDGGGYLSTGDGSAPPLPTVASVSSFPPQNNPTPPAAVFLNNPSTSTPEFNAPISTQFTTVTATGGYLSVGGSEEATPVPVVGGPPVQVSQNQNPAPSITLAGPEPILVVSDGRTTAIKPTPITIVSNGHTSTWSPSPIVLVAGDGQTSTFIPNAPVPTTPATPTAPVVVLIDGKTSTLAPGSQATDASGAPLPILSVVGGKTFTATPSSVLQVIDGKTSTGYLTPVLTEINGHVFTEVPTALLATIDGKVSSAYQTPILTEINGQIYTEVPVAILATIDGKATVAYQTPVLTELNGHIYTEVPVAIPTTIDGKKTVVYQTPILTEVNGHIYTELPVAVPTTVDGTVSTAYRTPVLTEINGQIYTIMPLGAATSVGYGSNSKNKATATTLAIFPTATIVNSTGTFFAWSNGATTWAPQITQDQYIIVSFLPLILAVLYTIPWRILDTTIREMEPFYQLSQPGGAFAENSLLLDYVFWSSLISLVVLILAPLSSEALFVSLSGTCGPNLPPCHASWGIYPTLARLMQGLFSFIAILLVCIMYYTPRRTTGIYSEPLSIAGLACLLYKSPLLSGLREIDSQITAADLTKIFEGKCFAIQPFLSMDQRKCYGIVPVEAEDGEDVERGVNGGYYSLGSDDQFTANQKPGIMAFWWWVIKEKLFYICAFLMLSGVLCLITYYHYTWGNSGFERFMDSQAFGIRFLMTALGVVVKLFWTAIDQDLRKLFPYHRLLSGSAEPEDSILSPCYASPFSAIIPSLLRQHYLIALISFVTILSEVLPICLANIAFSPAMTQTAYTTSTFLSLSILILMLLSLLILLFRHRSSKRPLPRKPDTLASILVYVASKEDYSVSGRSMIDSFSGLSTLCTRERDENVKGMGCVYAMGVVEGDGLRVDDDRRVKRFW